MRYWYGTICLTVPMIDSLWNSQTDRTFSADKSVSQISALPHDHCAILLLAYTFTNDDNCVKMCWQQRKSIDQFPWFHLQLQKKSVNIKKFKNLDINFQKFNLKKSEMLLKTMIWNHLSSSWGQVQRGPLWLHNCPYQGPALGEERAHHDTRSPPNTQNTL